MITIKRNIVPAGLNTVNPAHFFALGFGTGLSPYAPGTIGTLAALPIYALMQWLGWAEYGIFLALLILFGFWICGIADKAAGVHDHSSIVWDEIVGYLLTLWMIPNDWQWIVIGFVLFRLYDIWKPWPISWLNHKVSGGVGVVVDDLLAGVFANITLQIIIWVLR